MDTLILLVARGLSVPYLLLVWWVEGANNLLASLIFPPPPPLPLPLAMSASISVSEVLGIVTATALAVVVGSVAAAWWAFNAFTRVQLPGHQRVVRNAFTGRARCLPPGLAVLLPWEQPVVLALPSGIAFDQRLDTAQADAHYRYCPAPYTVQTNDGVDAVISVWIEYVPGDLVAIADGDAMRPADRLGDTVRAALDREVGQLDRGEVTASLVSALLARPWLNGASLRIARAGVLHIGFSAAPPPPAVARFPVPDVVPYATGPHRADARPPQS